VGVEVVPVTGNRPGGRRFGTLVHAILRDVPLDANATQVARLATLNARAIGAPDAERDAAAIAVENALRHPLIERARKAERCYREYPITLALDDGRLLDGIIDLAFVENDSWMIVDFKTDGEAAARKNQYARQLQWYAFALARLTGMSARASLLAV
jgi:ATP-dependent helicase/nuclease subunit A